MTSERRPSSFENSDQIMPEITFDPARLQLGQDFVTRGLADGRLKPIIAKTFPFEKIADAHRFVESNEPFGKIMVTI
jgi:NADPH:quinone reductase-like Zn-dependent oxidoreductase